MGKMIDAQSIVVASTATNWFGHEGTILRFVFWHSIALACLVGLFVMLQAYVWPTTPKKGPRAIMGTWAASGSGWRKSSPRRALPRRTAGWRRPSSSA